MNIISLSLYRINATNKSFATQYNSMWKHLHTGGYSVSNIKKKVIS